MTIGGLFWYEVVLLVLGVVLFIVLIDALRKNLSAGKSYAGLLPFFVLTIAMIGYPSITSIQYNKGMVSIDTDASQIEANPGSPQNAALRQQIQANLSRYESRGLGARQRGCRQGSRGPEAQNLRQAVHRHPDWKLRLIRGTARTGVDTNCRG